MREGGANADGVPIPQPSEKQATLGRLTEALQLRRRCINLKHTAQPA
jgi:hypothetical protein